MSAPTSGFATALIELQTEHARISTTGATVEHMIAVNEAFFNRVDLGAIGLPEIAALVRLNAFAYGDKAHTLALSVAERLGPIATQPDVDGALAAVLRMALSTPAGVAKSTRGEWGDAFLHHPAMPALLQSEFGDLALDSACRAARTAGDNEFLLGLAQRLDASNTTAAARAIPTYWTTIKRLLPEGDRRQTLRVQLTTYLAAVVAIEKREPRDDRSPLNRETLAALQGAEARGELLGRQAPEIHFAWSSRDGLKQLSRLRGKIVMLDFWATWCGPCVEALPEVAGLAARYRGFDVEIIGVTSVQGAIIGLRSGTVDCKGDPEKEMRLMAAYLKERAITWPVVFSREPVLNPDYGVQGLPNLTLIAPDGTVRYSAPGLRPADVRNRIDALLMEFRRPVPMPGGVK